MALNKKLIYYNRTLSQFLSDANGLNNQTTKDANGNVGNIPFASIVFTNDGYIWTHGKQFNCNNTWRGIQNNLTSTSTTDSLSAYQGKILNDKFANYLPLAGGTMSNTNLVTNLNADRLDGKHASDIWNINVSYVPETTATVKYFKVEGMWGASVNHSYAYIITTRSGESYYCICGNSDSSAATPAIIRLHNVYTKIAGFRYSADVLYIKCNTYSNSVHITQFGDTLRTLTITEVSESDYNAATAITVKVSANTSDNVASATKLQTARTITIGSKSNSFDGSENISFTLAQIGALAAGSYKTVQTAVGTIGASTNTLTFINSISQDTNGVITATTGVVRDASTSVAGVVNTTTQSFAGTKTFTGQTIISTNNFGKLLVLNRGNDGGTWGPSIIFQNNGTFSKCIGVDVNGVAYIGDNGSTNYKIYHAGNLSIGTLMGSTAIGDSDEPVYWSGSAFVKAGAYPTKASWNYDDKYLPLTGANYNTNTDTNPFIISRTGGASEAMAISVNDSLTTFKYTNDEYSSLFVFRLVNTDIENSNGSRASDRNVTISSSNSGISMAIGGNTVWHAGNLTTSAAASGGTTASLVTTGDKYKWNTVYDWLTTTTADTDTTINKWKELEAFLTSITESDTLSGLLAGRVAKSGDTMTGALTTPGLTVTGASTFSLAIDGSILGNAATASRLQNARTITLTGSVTGSGSFDGSGNLSIATTTNHNHNSSYMTAAALFTGASAATSASASLTNGNVYLNATKTINGSTTNVGSVKISGSGGVSVTTDANGHIGVAGTVFHLRAGANNGTANSTSATSDPYLLLVGGSTLDSQVQLKASTGISISANGGIVTITNSSPNSHTYTSTWTSKTDNNNYPIAFSPNATPATSGNGYNANFTFNPSTKTFNNNGSKQVYDSTNKVLKFIFD